MLNEREVVPTEWIRSPVAAVIHRDGFEVAGGGRFFTSDSRHEESEHPPSRIKIIIISTLQPKKAIIHTRECNCVPRLK